MITKQEQAEPRRTAPFACGFCGRTYYLPRPRACCSRGRTWDIKLEEAAMTDKNALTSNQRFDIQLVKADPIGHTPENWRVTDTRSDSRVATCFDSDNARMVRDALNAYFGDGESEDGICEEADGCPTEKAVLQRYWRENRPMHGVGLPSPVETKKNPPHWTCRTHGDFDAMRAIGCPECMREARQALIQIQCELYGSNWEAAKAAHKIACSALDGALTTAFAKALGDCKHERAALKCPDCGIDFVGTLTQETSTELCPNCGKDEVGTFTADDSFLYGRQQYRLIAKDVLCFRCMACGLEYTGEDGESKRMEAVRAHLARQAAEKASGCTCGTGAQPGAVHTTDCLLSRAFR